MFMKKLFLFLIFNFSFFIFVSGQVKDTTKYWKKGGFALINFSQASLTHWAAGGNSSVAFTGMGNIFANYKKGNSTWDNSLDLGYGVLETSNGPLKKSEDKIELNSKYGQLASGKFYYSGLMGFKTTFSPGYNYPDAANPNERVYVSRFLAPAYLILSLGIDYKPVDYFDIYLSPATGRFTFINDKSLADAGAFGVEPAQYDPVTGLKTKDGQSVKSEFGAYLNIRFQKDIMKNVNLMTKLGLFDNYTAKNKEDRTSIIVNWEALIGMKVNKFLVASVYMNVIYDQSIKVPLVYDATNKIVLQSGPRTQIKEVLGIGLSYKF